MPSYKDNPTNQKYLDSIKKHTDGETNKVNLALVAKDFGYTTGNSFQKKYAKLKKAHNLTNGHIYGDYMTATPEVPTPETAATDVTQTHLKETFSDEAKGQLRSFLIPWGELMLETRAREEKEREEKEHGATKKGKRPEKKKKKKKKKKEKR
ncbi:hypothetical protein ACN38_g10363 [Penicillium nordicum]|uniref:Myb-like DNA-binding domain-containing protein n=1 Tax=Penicillium nordicum TaxID=229535 RepID=A0A0M9WBX0_9EURO|nr:hypothetical protein ACN38_g10363 [Penicillium nordicum]